MDYVVLDTDVASRIIQERLTGPLVGRLDSWIAACCLTRDVPLATLNTKDYADLVNHEGLALLPT